MKTNYDISNAELLILADKIKKNAEKLSEGYEEGSIRERMMLDYIVFADAVIFEIGSGQFIGKDTTKLKDAMVFAAYWLESRSKRITE